MFYLVLPPAQMISENFEISTMSLKNVRNYQDKFLEQLLILPSSELKTMTLNRNFKKWRVFVWDKSYNAILSTYFVFFDDKKRKSEFFHAATLTRKHDCIQLGSTWEVVDSKAIPLQISNSLENLKIISDRTLPKKTPIQVHSTFNFLGEEKFRTIFDIILSENLSAKKISNVTELSKIACQTEILNEKKEIASEVTPQPHLIVKSEILSKQSLKNGNWPEIQYSVQVNSGIFGNKKGLVVENKNYSLFDPQQLSKEISEKITPYIQNLDDPDAGFKVTKRFGSWIYINKGRAFGLQIGTRLVGPSGAKLHIIRFAPAQEEINDVSIAFVRHEDPKKPINIGDTLNLDQTIYPKVYKGIK